MGLRIPVRKSERLHGFKNGVCAGLLGQRPQQALGWDIDQRWLWLSQRVWIGSGLCRQRFIGGGKGSGWGGMSERKLLCVN